MKKVENYRQTKDQKAFAKNVRKTFKVEQALKKAFVRKVTEVQLLRQQLEELMGQKQQLMDMAPKKPVHELPGQMEELDHVR